MLESLNFKTLLLLSITSTLAVPISTNPGSLHGGHWVTRRSFTSTTRRPVTQSLETDANAKLSKDKPKIHSMNIKSDIKLRYAKTLVTSRVANPASVAQEAIFHVVLPQNAFISGFVMEIDGIAYEALVKEKQKAQTEYDQAISQGQAAAQVSSARDANQFTVSVNIEPRAKVTFNLTYEELLVRRHGIYEHLIHVNPGQVVENLSIDVDIAEVLPLQRVRVPALRDDIKNNEVHEMDNPLAKVTLLNATGAAIRYRPNKKQQFEITKDGLQGQFVVQYDVDRSSMERKGGEIHVVDGYFVHFFAPETLLPLPKHVVFVLDTSGSMAGLKLAHTKQAMESILDQLRQSDFFSVIEFSSNSNEWDLTGPYRRSFSPWYSKHRRPSTSLEGPLGPFDAMRVYPATKAAIARAKEFVRSMEAAGGTNINEALLMALRNSQSVQSMIQASPMIIFLTDGQPMNGVTSLQAIAANVKRANSDGVVSLFSLAFGSGADFEFLKTLSTQNGAFARKIYDAADASVQLKGFFAEVASPLLSNVWFAYEGAPTSAVTQTKIGTFYRGNEIVVCGVLDDSSATDLGAVIHGHSATGPALIRGDANISRPKLNSSGALVEKGSFSLEKTWAYLTITELLRKNQAQSNANDTKKALDLSLKFKFVTPLTSLLVVKPNKTATNTALESTKTGSTSVADPPHHHRHQSTTALSVSKFSRPFQLATPPISSFTDLTGMRFGTASIRKASATTTTAPATTTTPTTTTTDWSSSVASLAFAEKDDVSASTSTVKDLLDLEHQQTVTIIPTVGGDLAELEDRESTTISTSLDKDLPEIDDSQSTTVPSTEDLLGLEDPQITTISTSEGMDKLEFEALQFETTPRPEDVRFGLEAYEHNATHVTLPIDGLNRTVSWENELADTDFRRCNATYSDGQATDAFCRSIWHCPTIGTPAVDDFCLIGNEYTQKTYLGVCCIKIEEGELILPSSVHHSTDPSSVAVELK